MRVRFRADELIRWLAEQPERLLHDERRVWKDAACEGVGQPFGEERGEVVVGRAPCGECAYGLVAFAFRLALGGDLLVVGVASGGRRNLRFSFRWLAPEDVLRFVVTLPGVERVACAGLCRRGFFAGAGRVLLDDSDARCFGRFDSVRDVLGVLALVARRVKATSERGILAAVEVEQAWSAAGVLRAVVAFRAVEYRLFQVAALVDEIAADVAPMQNAVGAVVAASFLQPLLDRFRVCGDVLDAVGRDFLPGLNALAP